MARTGAMAHVHRLSGNGQGAWVAATVARLAGLRPGGQIGLVEFERAAYGFIASGRRRVPATRPGSRQPILGRLPHAHPGAEPRRPAAPDLSPDEPSRALPHRAAGRRRFCRECVRASDRGGLGDPCASESDCRALRGGPPQLVAADAARSRARLPVPVIVVDRGCGHACRAKRRRSHAPHLAARRVRRGHGRSALHSSQECSTPGAAAPRRGCRSWAASHVRSSGSVSSSRRSCPRLPALPPVSSWR